jgi:hypothetical protein
MPSSTISSLALTVKEIKERIGWARSFVCRYGAHLLCYKSTSSSAFKNQTIHPVDSTVTVILYSVDYNSQCVGFLHSEPIAASLSSCHEGKWRPKSYILAGIRS